MPNANMYFTVKKVNPERLRCPVKDCAEEGKEENKVDTPFIAGLGPMTVYLCDTHAGALAAMLLEKNFAVDGIQWDEPEKQERASALMRDCLSFLRATKELFINKPLDQMEIHALIGRIEIELGVIQEDEAQARAHMEHYQMSVNYANALIENYSQGQEEVTSITYRERVPFTEDEREALGRAHLDNYQRVHEEDFPW